MMALRLSSVGLVLFSTSWLCVESSAQAEWTRLSPETPTRRYGHGMVYDVARQRVVMFRGYQLPMYEPDTWEWDGFRWLDRRPPGPMPTAVDAYGLAYDSDRNRTVLYGTLGATDHTWEWDGSRWLQVAANTFRSRHATAMAYHPPSRRVVRFGGSDPGGQLGAETWEWNGASWLQRISASSPSARSGHAMVYDAARGVVVLFGGYTYAGMAADTWEWNGSNWLRRTSATSPPPRSGCALAYDSVRQCVVLHAGYALTVVYDDTWEWDGNDWTQRTLARRPPLRTGGAMTFDGARGQVVLFGGEIASGPLQDTWCYDGVDWRAAQPGAPYPRELQAMATHPSRAGVVLFGGYTTASRFAIFGDTWTWDAGGWQPLTTADAPSPRQGVAMSVDPGRGNLVLFGGATFTTQWDLYGDTWTFADSHWTQQSPASSPPPMNRAAAAYDPSGDRVILFGSTGETWAWKGNDWQLLQTAVRPPARSEHAMATDHRRGGVLLFGGRLSSTAQVVGDTWEWKGNEWRLLAGAGAPSPRFRPAMAWDPVRDRIVLHGGEGSMLEVFADTWEWDGERWLQRRPATSPAAMSGPSLCWDRHTESLLLFGGEAQTWSYATATPAAFSRFGAGCPGRAGTPSLDPLPGSLPWLGDRLQVQFSRLPDGDGFVFVHLGFSRSLWRGLSLPFDLAAFGMPGCSLWTGADAVFPLAITHGRATWSLPIGIEPETLGIEFFTQGIAMDRNANAAGFVVSNGGAGRTGMR